MIHLKTLAGGLAAAALTLSLPAAAGAGVVTFDNLAGPNQSPFTTYSEAGFTVTKTAGDAFVGMAYGNPVPDIFAGPLYGSASTTLEITAGGDTFSFDSWDLSPNNGSAAYVINGFLNGGSVFSTSGLIRQLGFQTLLSGTSLAFDRLTFTLTANGTSLNFDNFAGTISAVPEPAAWAMMIVGFGAVGTMVRASRRRNVLAAA